MCEISWLARDRTLIFVLAMTWIEQHAMSRSLRSLSFDKEDVKEGQIILALTLHFLVSTAMKCEQAMRKVIKKCTRRTRLIELLKHSRLNQTPVSSTFLHKNWVSLIIIRYIHHCTVVPLIYTKSISTLSDQLYH